MASTVTTTMTIAATVTIAATMTVTIAAVATRTGQVKRPIVLWFIGAIPLTRDVGSVTTAIANRAGMNTVFPEYVAP
ncbi:MAG: hypothetical protein HYR94_29665, partial [Chloroflexi bacterium]|nr:hypothetical protein [Chloroflexota bacterium]